MTEIILALATFRLARLIVTDTILDPPRAWILSRWPGDDTEFTQSVVEHDDQGSWYSAARDTVRLVGIEDDLWVAANPTWFGRWLECVWCVSIWVAVVVVALHHWWAWFQYPAMVLAFSAVAGWVHTYTSE
ncbi:MAG: DUF1360 domain-containing protein [bacterium]|nr:DUF1360 domain-containing protein [bacterium]